MPDTSFTEAQNAVAFAIDRSMSVVAGAGSGKTTVLIERCLHIIEDDWGALDRLLAITFTEKAAGELKARLRRRIPAEQHHRIEEAWIGTFHAFCARIIRAHTPVLGLDPSFGILDENAAGLVARQAVHHTLMTLLEQDDAPTALLVDALDFRTVTGALEELMQFRWHAQRIFEQPAAAEEAALLSALGAAFTLACTHLSAQFARMDALDFQALEIQALRLLTEHPSICELYQRRFSHLLVDEFQDTNDLQTLLVLKLFDPKRNRLCIVGDPRQSIYRFRGANVGCFAQTLERIRAHGGETIHLAENFRSRPGIITFVNHCQENLSDGLFEQLAQDGVSAASENMIAARDDDGALPSVARIPIVSTDAKTSAAERRIAEAEAIAQTITALTSSDRFELGDIVCLFQALTDIVAYENALQQAGIPYRVFGGRGLLARQEIVDLLLCLEYAADPENEIALLGLVRSPLIGLSDDDLVRFAGPRGDSLVEAARIDERCGLLNDLQEMGRHLRPSEIIRRVLDRTGYELICHALDTSGGMTANIDRFLALAESIERETPTPLGAFAGFVRELKERSARLGNAPAAGDASGAVRLMTVHAAKGLEFPVVILPDLFRGGHNTGGRWQFVRQEGIAFKQKDPDQPFGPRVETDRYSALRDHERTEDEAESKRLLYVAMTRAMELLLLPIHEGISRSGPWHKWLEPVVVQMDIPTHEGRSLAPLAGAKDEGRNIPQNTIDVSPLGALSPFTLRPSPLVSRHVYTVSQLECFERCPREYELKYVLGLPATGIFREGDGELPANVLGSIVHGVLDGLDPSDLQSLTDQIRTGCLRSGADPTQQTLRAVQREIEHALKIPLLHELREGAHELPFEWRIDAATIIGSIDWLKPDGDGFEVIDFKTDRVDADQVEERAQTYDLQLICYALAAEAATGKRISATTLTFLKPQIVHRIEMTDARRTDGLARIRETMQCIEAHAFEQKKETQPPCQNCAYHHNGICWEDRLKSGQKS